jgi:hypothetical protein
MLTIAHAGHWAINLLYVAPLLVVVGVLGVQSLKSRRELRREGGEARRPPPPPPAAGG